MEKLDLGSNMMSEVVLILMFSVERIKANISYLMQVNLS